MRPLTMESVLARCRADGECLLWIGTVTGTGYPTAKHEGRRVQVRRWVFDAMSGKPPLRRDQYPVMECEQKLCLNSHHMVAKTKSGYMKLAAANGVYSRPEKMRKLERSMRASSNAKLDIHKAREIRRRYAAGESSHELGKEFNVHHSVITAIGANHAWREVANSVFTLALAA